MMLTTIPFSGFYESLHDSALDDAMNNLFMDDGCFVNEQLAWRAYSECNWRGVHLKYAEEYAGQFADEFNISLTFESMQSPREYNFTTDRIFCNIALEECMRLLRDTRPDTLNRIAAEEFTSRDGFASFYSPDVSEWGGIEFWDHNQVGALIRAYVADQNDDFDMYAEYNLMEDAQCNGQYDEWICENTPPIGRLLKVRNYLWERAEREEVQHA